MCGRFTLAVDPEMLMMRYVLTEIPFPFTPRYNAAPNQLLTAIISNNGENRAGQLKWGLVPSFSKDDKSGFKMINARAETIREKPSFRHLLTRKRAIIPGNSFFEWRTEEKGKQPMRILMKDERIFSFAALYDTWIGPEGGKLHTCTIITTNPNEIVAPIHNRMPVILREVDEQNWLDRSIVDADYLTSLLVPYDAKEMMAYPVHTMVGNVSNDTPECIAPLL